LVESDFSWLQKLGERLDEEVDGEKTRDWAIRTFLKIRPKHGGIRALELNRAQREYSRRCSKRNIVLKARQVGITTYVAARFFLHTITHPGTLTVQVAHSQDSAEMIFGIVKRFWENLPEREKRELVKSRSNARQIVFPRLDSEYRVETADENAGRGMTIQNLHCSEVSRWSASGLETLASLRAAVVPDGEIVLESTPNGATGPFYAEWQRADETGYSKHFFPWWYEESYREIVGPTGLGLFSEEERHLTNCFALDEGQLAWRRKQWKTLHNLAAQEYAEDPSSCFLVSGESIFEISAIEQAMALAGQEVRIEDNGRLLIWCPPQAGRSYIVGVDTAGGGSEGDYACAQVIDRELGVQCAELRGHFPPLELAKRVRDLGRRYEDALVVVEQNNHGHAVLVHLGYLECKNLYENSGELGWLTTAANRPAMIENMVAVLRAEPELFHSKRLLEECRTFVRNPEGGACAGVGAYDDCVMAMAIALAVRKEVVGRLTKKGVALASLVMSKERWGGLNY
jgi:hypothetical protein